MAVYDADHHPDGKSLRRLHRSLLASDCAAVQGSTYIRNTRGSILARAVNAEFFVTHFIYFPAMEVLGGTGYFGGSKYGRCHTHSARRAHRACARAPPPRPAAPPRALLHPRRLNLAARLRCARVQCALADRGAPTLPV